MTKHSSYHLGASDSEQMRLKRQRELYGDTADICFQATDRVCEFGCGPLTNYWIPEQLTKGQYVGVDIQKAQIDAAKHLANELELANVEFIEKDASATELESASFDASFLRCVLIHLPDPRPLLSEMLRVTRPGGRLILIEPHDPTYYVTPDKPNLFKVYRARDRFAYFEGRGTPDAALNLHSFLTQLGAVDISIRPHIIFATGQDPERCLMFLNNWLGLIRPVISSLIKDGRVTEAEWKHAQTEAETVSPETFLYQSMWIAEGQKPF